MLVSVVIPVYNPGRYITGLVDSLRAQTLDAREFEAVFVDDGSTDGTPALLDRLAATTPNVRVIHIPSSGWPGRPRNVGIDAARGDFVFLSDHDDRLDPGSLERLTGFALAHGSDVVIGRVVGVGRTAPDHVFARTVVDAQRHPALIMASLTPQKLYRKAFLDERAIRFPEGRRRLEDHLFVTKAYLRAGRVSVYADHPVYYFVQRDDGGNASRQRIAWAGYFANAAESLAVVDAEAPDDATRVTMRARWLRIEAISRLRGRYLLQAEDRGELLTAAREFVVQHYPPAEVDRLAPAERLVGRLLLDGREEDVVAFATWEASSALRVEVAGARVEASDRRLEVRLRAAPGGGGPLPDALADLPAGYPTAAELAAVAGIPRGVRLTARLRLPSGAVAEMATTAQTAGRDAVLATASLDLGAPPAEGAWRLRVSVRGAGRPRTDEPLLPDPARAEVDTTPVRIDGRRYALAVDRRRRLVLLVARPGPLPAARRAAGTAFRLVKRVLRAVRRRAARARSARTI